MRLNEENIRLIFGLKLRQLRTEKNFSLSELADKSGLSVSYLNEIEKGKKYPKGGKISSLATALDISYDRLVSLKLTKNLAPVGELLQSKILSDLPLELFGIELNKLIEIIANAPEKVNAFISTMIEIARNYNVTQENFYFAALRSYQESHDNYFEDLEKAAVDFIEKYAISSRSAAQVKQLEKIITAEFNYVIDDTALSEKEILKEMRSITVTGNPNKLFLNSSLDDSQRAFILAKELGFCYLGLSPRAFSFPLLKAESFDLVLNNFKASYFAGAVLLNKNALARDVEKFFSAYKWDEAEFLRLIHKYTSSHETFMHRLTNLLPRVFHLNNLFFLRLDNRHKSDAYFLTKELHLAQLHNPHGSGLDEQYCRRWVSVRVLKEIENLRIKNKYREPVIGIQRSKYYDSENEYLIISVARPLENIPGQNNSVSIGILINNELKKRIRFWNDDRIPVRFVNQTCERCPAEDCRERVSPPMHVERVKKSERLEEAISGLIKGPERQNHEKSNL